MKSNDLRTNEIVTRLNVFGDLDIDLAAAGIHVLDPPVVVIADTFVRSGPSVFIDFDSL